MICIQVLTIATEHRGGNSAKKLCELLDKSHSKQWALSQSLQLVRLFTFSSEKIYIRPRSHNKPFLRCWNSYLTNAKENMEQV